MAISNLSVSMTCLCSSNAMRMSARSKVWVCGRSPAEVVGSDPPGGHGCLSLVSFVCYQVQVSKEGQISRSEEL